MRRFVTMGLRSLFALLLVAALPACNSKKNDGGGGLTGHAVGTGYVSTTGDVLVVTGNPVKWTTVYKASDSTENAKATALSISGKSAAYLLDDGDVHIADVAQPQSDAITIDMPSSEGAGDVRAISLAEANLALLTEDGSVWLAPVGSDSTAESLWQSDDAKATDIDATKDAVVTLLDSGQVLYIPLASPSEPIEVVSEAAVQVGARGTDVAVLDQSGKVNLYQIVNGKADKGRVIWNVSGSEVSEMDLETNLIVLLEDGSVRSKATKNEDATDPGRPAWRNADGDRPATAIAAKGPFVYFELSDGAARRFDPSVPKNKRPGAYPLAPEADEIESLAS